MGVWRGLRCWQAGLRHGKGKATFANQDCYLGDFFEGQVTRAGETRSGADSLFAPCRDTWITADFGLRGWV